MANSSDSGYRMGKGMLIVAWLLLLLLLATVFQQWLNDQQQPNRNPDSIMSASGIREVTLERNRNKQYLSRGTINGITVDFLVDTGASEVALSDTLARKLDLPRGMAGRATTASGIVTTYATELEEISIGNIRLDKVPARITPGMPMDSVLLGMSALHRIEFTQRGDQLILRQYPES